MYKRGRCVAKGDIFLPLSLDTAILQQHLDRRLVFSIFLIIQLPSQNEHVRYRARTRGCLKFCMPKLLAVQFSASTAAITSVKRHESNLSLLPCSLSGLHGTEILNKVNGGKITIVAQLIECWICCLKVVGSFPTVAKLFFRPLNSFPFASELVHYSKKTTNLIWFHYFCWLR